MAFVYKLEYMYDGTTSSDASVFIHMKNNPPVYLSRASKEDYDVMDDEDKHEFLTNIFLIAGVTELSSKAYRIWIMKSPVYSWSEVVLPVLHYMKSYFGETTISPLPGSANTDGTGGTVITDANQRREL